MRFIIEDVVGIDEIAALPGYEDASPDVTAAILEEAGKFAGEVLAETIAHGPREWGVAG